ncbi:polysaccharide deacetylase family protein [Duganella sp. FT134W]|uniref:Polysaccharide deacetylase family protein n=1 Tax=Duganella margarita TaxID=2692170 RepID=A0A7X4GYZ9_9BURK|nr:polysaccharide deacetylase family protein [Duganella margarita]MYM72283.1 polysaccharide deacetylase family protein [Duganella margarita]
MYNQPNPAHGGIDAPGTIAPRRNFLAQAGGAVAGALTAGAIFSDASAHTTSNTVITTRSASAAGGKGFWPNGARLAVSVSMMFEGGGQPISGVGGLIPEPIDKGVPDFPTNAFFAYGHYEGIPRALDLFDKHNIKVSSFMIGEAVKNAPELAQEIVRRGHEAAAHGRIWANSYNLSRSEEKRFIADSAETIHRITGQQPVGWNAYFLRNSVHILETLQELGFLYHIDEPSRDEPFIIPVKGKDFVTVPYTLHLNDISAYPFEGYNPMAYEQALKDEFDQLYEEGATRRRMMLVGFHDRINGHANRIRVLDRFFTYAKSKPDVWFARKDEIARWVLAHRDQTPILQRGPGASSGLPGPG